MRIILYFLSYDGSLLAAHAAAQKLLWPRSFQGCHWAIFTSALFRLVTSRTSINELLILRLLIHPTIWSMLVVLFSNTVRHIGAQVYPLLFFVQDSPRGWQSRRVMSSTGAVPNLMQAVLWIWPVMYKSIYGRFLLLQLGPTSNVVALNVLMSVFNVASRLSSRQVAYS